ncbi:MAG: ABC transporter permease [Streptosporangiaceae bacterium]
MWPASSSPTCYPPTSTPRSWSASRSPRTTCPSTATPPPPTSKPPTAGSTPFTTCSPTRPTPKTPAACRYPSRPTPSSPKPTPKARSAPLFLGLGAVALLVGAIGVANIMVISVLERRSEIGLRRALGATRGQIRTQFLAEAIALSLIGGVAGIITGAAATAIYAHGKGWTTVIPTDAWTGGLAATILIGALAGLLPAIRAARLSPTQALWSI